MGTTYKRALSESQARRCEEAAHPACRCRCHGAMHGAKRSRDTDAPDYPGWQVGCDCAAQIEAGTHPKACPCLCHPVLRAFFEALPADDPHHLPTEAERRERRHRKHRKQTPQPTPAIPAAVQMAWC